MSVDSCSRCYGAQDCCRTAIRHGAAVRKQNLRGEKSKVYTNPMGGKGTYPQTFPMEQEESQFCLFIKTRNHMKGTTTHTRYLLLVFSFLKHSWVSGAICSPCLWICNMRQSIHYWGATTERWIIWLGASVSLGPAQPSCW